MEFDVADMVMLKKCLADENLVIPLEEIQMNDKLHFIEEPVEIIDCEVMRLKKSHIPIVKVRWNSQRGPEYMGKGRLFHEEIYVDVRQKPMEFDVADMVMLKKCLANENLVIPLEEIQMNDKLHFIEEPVEIIDCEVMRLKQSHIPIVKVRWNSQRGPEYMGKGRLFHEEVSASIPKKEARAWR
nr:putative reverse transcriptase domain-containing protein [Tanacetum cinerariifolium]